MQALVNSNADMKYEINENIKNIDPIVETEFQISPRFVSTADAASLVFPRTKTTTLTAALVGFVFAFGLVFLIDSFDQAILGEKDFTSHFDVPLIGVIPDFESTGVVAPSNYYQKGGKDSGY